ncbi:MAG: CDP-alcohol phosphatidyltransferase family protein [Acidimicrobiia bacterium]|nr:CDP-alcohol phosphatidyltransferase family protein [Acidimicrobiia bacterium]
MLDLKARSKLAPVLDPVAAGLDRMRMTPMFVTLLGLAVTIVGSVLIAAGELAWGAGVAAIGALLDALDGPLARRQGTASIRGAFVDTISDRLGEIAIWTGLAYHVREEPILLLLCLIALAFSLMTPYVRARAEAWGAEGRGGWMGRAERLIVSLLGIGLHGLGLPVLDIMLWAMVVLTGLTVAQRIRKTWGQLPAG